MSFRDALIASSPVLLGMGQQLSGNNPTGIASGIAMMSAESEKAKRKANIQGLLDSMNLSQQKRAFLETLPLDQQTPMIWDMMNPRQVEGKVMGDRLVNPYTGESIADFSPKPLDLSGIFGSPQGQAIKAGLMRRGLPEHVADAFLVNMNDESGLDPSINERQPLVPGSRGGFGLAQWTGPRRKQLEAFAAARGLPVDDMNTQLDFLMEELGGAESQAGQAILNAPDRAAAAQAIVNKYLRPAEPHRDARSERYASLDKQIGKITGILASGQGTPAQREALEFRRERLMDEQAKLAPQESPIAALEARAQAAGLTPGTPEYRQFMLTNGRNDGLVIESDGSGGFRVAQGAAAGNQRFNEVESKTNIYFTRAKGALDVLEPVAGELTNPVMRAVNADPTGIVRGGVQSDDFQIAKQAGEEFLLSILRKDTGAAVTPSEEVLYGRTYLPQPGDSEKTLKAKSEARKRALAAIESGMSPAQIIAAERALGDEGAALPDPPKGFSQEEWREVWELMPEEDRVLFR